MKPRLLDLFGGACGAGHGYQLAGFHVTSVDILPQPRSVADEFIQADVFELGDWLRSFDAIHASPPCQAYSKMNGLREGHPDLISKTRELLDASGLLWVIENIEDARDELRDPIMLCGTMFDPILDVRRHRLFEANWELSEPAWACRHSLSSPRFEVYEHGKWRLRRFVPVYGHGGGKTNEKWASAMEIDWMTHHELKEAIPPRYTEFIGGQLLAHVKITA